MRNGTFRGEAGGDDPGHSDHYCVDEAAFATGVAFYAQAAYDFLMEE